LTADYALIPLASALRVEQGHPDLVGDFVELFVVNGVESFAAAFEMLVHLHGLFLHRAVGFLAAADQFEILAGGDAGMTVLAVEAEAQEAGFLLHLWRFALLAHGVVR
jgi:hypothetical protein